jgi:transposase
VVSICEVMNWDHVCVEHGCQWRAIPKDLPPRSTVHNYLVLWSCARRGESALLQKADVRADIR